MDLKHYKDHGYIHFIGCGGAGTRPLMKIFHELGFSVSGSDLANSESVEHLRSLGLTVHVGHDAGHLPVRDGSRLLVVYSSAVPDGNPELAAAKECGAVCIRRGDVLGLVAGLFPCVIAVSGSHGKTSVSAMIAHALKAGGLNPGYLIGANVNTWEDSGSAGAGKIFVCEADESDGTHTAIHSTVAVVTNVEDDHCWNFASPEVLMQNFRKFALQGRSLIASGQENSRRLFRDHPDALFLAPGSLLEDPRFSSFGYYRRLNALTALEALLKAGLLDRSAALEALLSFPGVDRRMTLHFRDESRVLVEDYAHHPTELSASMKTLRELYPDRKLTVVFQPHRYARLKQYFHEFARELSHADRVFITPVFAAWTPSDSLNSDDLANAVGSRATSLHGSWEAMAREVADSLEEKELIAVIGAGDIKEILAPLRGFLSVIPDLGLILAAGGSSERYGTRNKLMENLGGMPLFLRCLKALSPCVAKGHLVLSVPASEQAEFEAILNEFLPECGVTVVPGGTTRTRSVRNAMNAMPPDVSILAVHDAARPFVTPAILAECVRECRIHGGAVSAHPVSDTLKEADAGGMIARTVSRANLWAVQTPQVFDRRRLEKAYVESDRSDMLFTDDASLVEHFTDTRVKLVETHCCNLKITYPEDLPLAEALLKAGN